MPLPLLFAFALAQDPQDQQSPAQSPQEAINFTKPYEVLEINRIAATPKIDGRIEEEEWDPIGAAGSGKAYYQWEPNRFHIAAVVPEGHELLASFDMRQNGWLIGSDNLEVRIKHVEGKPVVSARLLDGTRLSGPTWIDLPGFEQSSQVAEATEGGMTTYEISMTDNGIGLLPVESGAKLAIRVDAPLVSESNFEPFLPRVLSNVVLGMQRFAALPTGLKFNVEGVNKSVTPGEDVRLRLTFNGANSLNLMRLAMRSEGLAKDVTSKLEVPFPKFDNKGRAFVDYNTAVAAEATLGYRILRAELFGADGIPAMMQASYRIAPPIDFDLVRQQIPVNANDRSAKYAFYVRSNTGGRVTGNVTLEVPAPLRVLNGATRTIQIAGRQRQRMDFELFLPENTAGTFPVTFKSTLNGITTEQVGYFTVGGI
jgi:hypothetical protein